MIRKTLFTLALMAAATASQAAPVSPFYTTFGNLAGATFGGSGIPTDPTAITTANGVTLGLTAFGRYANPSLTNDGAGTFTATPGANTGLDVSNAFLARRGVAAEVGELTVAVGTAAGMTFWLGTGDPKFEEIEAGPYTLCAIPFGDITDQQVLQRVMRNLDKITAVCMPLTITPAPKNPETTFEIPAMAPLPEDAE